MRRLPSFFPRPEHGRMDTLRPDAFVPLPRRYSVLRAHAGAIRAAGDVNLSPELEREYARIIYTVGRGIDRRAEAEKSVGRERLAALLASTNRSLGQVGRHARARLRNRERGL